jgi:hypothetical protein
MEDIITAMAIIFCEGDIQKFGTVDFRKPVPK